MSVEQRRNIKEASLGEQHDSKHLSPDILAQWTAQDNPRGRSQLRAPRRDRRHRSLPPMAGATSPLSPSSTRLSSDRKSLDVHGRSRSLSRSPVRRATVQQAKHETMWMPVAQQACVIQKKGDSPRKTVAVSPPSTCRPAKASPKRSPKQPSPKRDSKPYLNQSVLDNLPSATVGLESLRLAKLRGEVSPIRRGTNSSVFGRERSTGASTTGSRRGTGFSIVSERDRRDTGTIPLGRARRSFDLTASSVGISVAVEVPAQPPKTKTRPQREPKPRRRKKMSKIVTVAPAVQEEKEEKPDPEVARQQAFELGKASVQGRPRFQWLRKPVFLEIDDDVVEEKKNEQWTKASKEIRDLYSLVSNQQMETYNYIFTRLDAQRQGKLKLKNVQSLLNDADTSSSIKDLQKAYNLSTETVLSQAEFIALQSIKDRIYAANRWRKYAKGDTARKIKTNWAKIEQLTNFLPRVQRVYEMMELNEDNHLDFDGLSTLLSAALGKSDPDLLTEIFRRIDSDGDGQITKADFLTFLPFFMSLHDRIVSGDLFQTVSMDTIVG